MPGLSGNGQLYRAVPPLYRLSQGGVTAYARDDAHKDELMASTFSGRGKVEISRFKGLGEMPATQLRDTTMKPGYRTLLKVPMPGRYEDGARTDARRTERTSVWEGKGVSVLVDHGGSRLT